MSQREPDYDVGDENSAGTDGFNGPDGSFLGRLRTVVFKENRAILVSVVRWFVFSVPAALFLWSVFSIAQNNVDERNEHLARLTANFRENPGSDGDALILAGTRLLDSGTLGMDDLFRLYDAWSTAGKAEIGLRMLDSKEMQQPASDLAEYRARFAERLTKVTPQTRENLLKAIEKYQQSLAGPLSKPTDKKVRYALGGLARATGNVDKFTELLKPLANEDDSVAVELIWTDWLRSIDQEPPAIRSAATAAFERLKSSLFQRMSQSAERPTEAEGLRLAKLYFVSGRSDDFFASVRELPAWSAETRNRILEVFDELAVLEEVSRKKPRSQVYSSKLVRILNREKVDKQWLDLATRIWATQELGRLDPIRLWMQNYRNSPKADYDFFIAAAQACHGSGRWSDARDMYENAVKKNPESLVALNNLAAMYYRFPPRDLKKALEMSERALKIDPGMIGVAETRAQVLARMGKLEEARIILESALPVFPKEWNIHNTLAQIYAAEGKTELARIHSARAAELNRPPGAEFYDKLDEAVSKAPSAGKTSEAKPAAATPDRAKPAGR